LELGFGRNGTSLGTGGMDAGWDAVSGAFRGFDVLNTNRRINNYVKDGGLDIPVALRAQYGYGDGVQKDQLWSILAGETSLAAILGADYEAKTISGGGSRTVLLGSAYREGMSLEEQMRLGVTLGHEAYRDGISGWGNEIETQEAVRGHTEIALRMLLGGENLAYDSNLANDLVAYFAAMGNQGSFNEYVNANYDSSEDFWLLKKDGTLVDDDSADLHWEAVEKDNVYKTIMTFPGMSKEESLVAMLGGNANARAILEINNITASDNLSNTELGAIIAATLNTGTGGSLAIEYTKFKDNLNKDWHGIYQSYAAKEAFYMAHTSRGVYRGDQALLRQENMGEAITSDLEYYAVMHPYLLEEIKNIGGTGVTDPLAYLVENTSEYTYKGWGSVTLHEQMHDGLRQAFDETLANGGVLPPATNDGLWLRFQDASYNGNLYLSMHAVGMAIDFDPANNGFYIFGNNELVNRYLNKYIQSDLETTFNRVQGWDNNQILAQYTREYSNLVNTELDSVNTAITRFLAQPNRIGAETVQAINNYHALKARSAELEKIRSDLSRDETIMPRLEFNLSKIFVNSMLANNFIWGGNWPYSRDYMHFEVKR
jgi:hypothetical protein